MPDKSLLPSRYAPVGGSARGPSVKQVPEWLTWNRPFLCISGLSAAKFLWYLNVLGCLLHLTGFCVTLGFALHDNDLSQPAVSLYSLNLTWVPNATDALVPVLVKNGDALSVDWAALLFFFLSFAAHLIVSALNFSGAFNGEGERPITTFQNFYYLWMHEARNPLRWLEYAFSASTMVAVISVTAGLNQIYHLIMIVTLMFTTMVFGHLAELFNKPTYDKDGVPSSWEDKNVLNRLLIHVLGWVPYAAAWACIFHAFLYNAGRGAQVVPDFVYAVVYAQFSVFTLFGLVQLVLLLLPNGPSYYWVGEATYLVLSVVAKGILGVVLIVNVIRFSSFDSALSQAIADSMAA